MLTRPLLRDLLQSLLHDPVGLPAIAANSPAAMMRAASSRLLAPPQQISSGSPYFSAETFHRLFVAVNGQVEFWWPNFITAQGGGAPGGGCSDTGTNAATATAQVTYTSRTTGSPVTVNLVDKTGGTTALSATAGGWFKATATIDAAAGSAIYPRIAGNIPGGSFFSLGKADIANGDKFQFGSSPIALTTVPVNTFPSFRTWYGPCLIAAQSGMPVAAFIGDSRDDGLKDMVSDATGNIGVYMRLFGDAIPCVNLSGRGDMAQSFASATHSARRRELLAYATFKAQGHGINDFSAANRTSAQVLADQATIDAIDASPSIYRTQNPFTINGITTPWNSSGETQRQNYNTAVRAKPVYFDPDGVLSNGSGGWSNEDAVNIDYLHETNLGNAYAAANGAVVGTSLAVHGIAARAAGAVYPSWGTNLLTFNRDPSNAAWTKNDTTVVTNQSDSEAGSSAQKVQETATTAKHSLAKGPITVTPGTFEVWMDIAPSGRDWVFFQIIDSTFAYQALAWFNVTTGAVGNMFNTDTTMLNCTARTITAIAGTAGFYRCKMTFDVGQSVTGIYVSAKIDTGNGADATYLGDTSKGITIRPQTWLRQTVVAPVPDTFDPANKSASVTLSESNLRMTSSASDKAARSKKSYSSGLHYFEIEMVAGPGSIGVANASQSVDAWAGSTANSRGIITTDGISVTGGSGTGQSGTGAIANGNVVGFFIDHTNNKMWARKNGVFGSGQDPFTNTGGFSLPTGALFVFVSGNNGSSFRVRTATNQFRDQPGGSYLPWNS